MRRFLDEWRHHFLKLTNFRFDILTCIPNGHQTTVLHGNNDFFVFLRCWRTNLVGNWTDS